MTDYSRCSTIVLFLLGLGFVIAGIVLVIVSDGIITSSVKKGCQLIDGTPSYKAWHDPPVPLHITFYAFNITNPNELNAGVVPNVAQIGPFVYKEVRNKEHIERYPNGTISYNEFRTYTFMPELSTADPNKTYVNTMNLVYMTLVNFLRAESVDRQARTLIEGFLSFEEKPIMNRTVHQLLWGYEDRLLQLVRKNLPKLVQSDIVSVYNASASQAGFNTFLINDGADIADSKDRVYQVGNILGFNGAPTVSYWSTDRANMINGTDSTLWHPDAKSTDDVYIFSADLCRSLHLQYHEKRNNDFGIENLRFVLPKEAFNNTLNQDFCLLVPGANKTHRQECLADGLMSMRTCIKLSGGSVSLPLPIISSAPHFLDGDPSLLTNVTGLSPNEDIHRSYMDVEPITGTVMSGARRMQVNLNVIGDSAVGQISGYRSCVYPMIWLEEHAQIDKASANEFKSAVSSPILIFQIVQYGFIAVGTLLFLAVAILIIRRHHQKRLIGDAFTTVPDETTALFS